MISKGTSPAVAVGRRAGGMYNGQPKAAGLSQLAGVVALVILQHAAQPHPQLLRKDDFELIWRANAS